MKIVCDSHIPFLKGVLEPYADVVYISGSDINHSTVSDADALIIRTRTKCNAGLLEGTKVRYIATATIGYDHIDTAWCDSHGITWTSAPGCNSGSVQQYMGSVLVTLAQRLGFDCKDKTIGIIGVGNVGTKVARLAALLGFKVKLCDPPRSRVEGAGDFYTLDEIISHCDIISCHVPLAKTGQDATYHLFDKPRLQSLRENQILINTSRGEVIDCTALKDVLLKKRIKAAVLDVWENEPDIDTGLLELLTIGTPHIAGYSLDGKATGTTMCVQALADYFGLSCREFEVAQIPQPLQPNEFTIDATGKKPQDILAQAILYTYNVMDDDAALRADIKSFELQRSNYPARREFQAFGIRLLNDESGRAAAFLREMGFNVID